MSQPLKQQIFNRKLVDVSVIALPEIGQKLESAKGTFTVYKILTAMYGKTVMLKNEDPNGFNPAHSGYDLYNKIMAGDYKIID